MFYCNILLTLHPVCSRCSVTICCQCVSAQRQIWPSRKAAVSSYEWCSHSLVQWAIKHIIIPSFIKIGLVMADKSHHSAKFWNIPESHRTKQYHIWTPKQWRFTSPSLNQITPVMFHICRSKSWRSSWSITIKSTKQSNLIHFLILHRAD